MDKLFDEAAGLPSATAWIVKRSQLAQARAADQLVGDAHARANAILEQAQLQAVEARDQAYVLGARHGVAAVLAPLLELASALVNAKKNVGQQAGLLLRECFDDMVAKDTTLIAMLDNVIATRMLRQGDELFMTIPPAAASIVDSLRSHAEAAGLRASVTVGNEPGHVLMAFAGHSWDAQIPALQSCAAEARCCPDLGDVDVYGRIAAALRDAATALEAKALHYNEAQLTNESLLEEEAMNSAQAIVNNENSLQE